MREAISVQDHGTEIWGLCSERRWGTGSLNASHCDVMNWVSRGSACLLCLLAPVPLHTGKVLKHLVCKLMDYIPNECVIGVRISTDIK